MKKRTAASIPAIMIFMVLSFVGTALGTDSDQIRAAQQKLSGLEYDPGPADGVMGAKTVQALKHFQVDRSLPVTGHLDSSTLQALGIESSRSIRRADNPDNRVALVIGNSRYRSAPLKNPVHDAEDIAAALERLNFSVIKRLDANQEQMDTAVNEFGRRLRRANIGFFFFAGHGMQVNLANYLIPVDSKITTESDVKYRALDAGIVVGKMQDADSKLNIVILDACRDNPFKRSFRSSTTGLAQMDAPMGTVIAFATSPGKKAGDGIGRNGVFTKNLLHFIDKPGLSVQEILNQAGLGVMRDTRKQQVPWISNTPIEKVYLTSSFATPGPDLPPETTGLSNMDDVIRKREDARAKWSQWQSRMDADYANAQRYEQSTALNTAEKRAVWEKFNNVWSAGNPYSTQDEIMRAKAGERVQYWQSQATVAMSIPPRTTPSASPGRTWTEPTTGMEFVWVEGGCFQMGSDYGDSDEKPVHRVCMDGFWMGKYEVTNRQYRKFEPSHSSRDYKGVNLNGDDQPAVFVSWNDAKAFISWLNGKTGKAFSLPTEAQWEYACRAGTGTMRYWGDGEGEACAYANVHDLTSKRINKDFTWENFNCDDGYSATSPVGRFKPNNFGLYDMLGNAWEWCRDGSDNKAYSKHGRNNPVITNWSNRVLRGGSWGDWTWNVRCADRYGDDPAGANCSYGFRLVLSDHK